MPHFLRNPKFASRPEHDGNYIVYNEADGVGFLMNGGSHDIWQLCDGTKDIDAITSDLIKKRPDGVPADVQQIVSKHIEILTVAGLIKEQLTAVSAADRKEN